MPNWVRWAIAGFALFLIIFLAVPFILSWTATENYREDIDVKNLSVDPGMSHYYEFEEHGKTYSFNLVDPGMAPLNIRDKVKYGFDIINHTEKYANHFVGGKTSCVNCHFCGGNTFGGKNGSISLVGATFWFPPEGFTLKDRINNCFMRSLNGKPLPKDHPIMEAIVAYIDWISHELKGLPSYPWRGLKPLNVQHVADIENGRKIYNDKCALCHMMDGEGTCEIGCTIHIPPLWGDHAFNDGAGMNRPEKMASFVYCNMPFGQPSLTKEEAIDVTAYVQAQPRPHFIPPHDQSK